MPVRYICIISILFLKMLRCCYGHQLTDMSYKKHVKITTCGVSEFPLILHGVCFLFFGSIFGLFLNLKIFIIVSHILYFIK